MAWIPSDSVDKFTKSLRQIYGTAVSSVVEAIKPEIPVVVILVTGFKPRGDDSRPDRGLMPLGRMLAGPGIQVLTFIWGPAKARMLTAMRSDLAAVARDNGLIEAARACSDFVIVDSINADPFATHTAEIADSATSSAVLSAPSFAQLSEHDVDAAVHFALTQPHQPTVFEGMCNPPGGDWSGISLLDADGLEVRWTSLPRVSLTGAKRPDHVVQIRSRDNYILSIESKYIARDLELNVGPALVRYLTDLMKTPPNICRTAPSSPWLDQVKFKDDSSWNDIYSVATFVWNGLSDLRNGLERANADLAVAWLIDPSTDEVHLHLASRPGLEFLAHDFKELTESSVLRIVVEEH
jgi:hypothetical protein